MYKDHHSKSASFIAALAACLLFGGCADPQTAMTYTELTAEEAKEKMDTSEGYVILDVRDLYEYEESHIPGAVCIPVDKIESRAAGVITDKEQVILVYCRSGRRSKTAAEKLSEMGYVNVFDFGGIIDWPYETESGEESEQASVELELGDTMAVKADEAGMEVTGFHDLILESSVINNSGEGIYFGNPFSLFIYEDGAWKEMEWREEISWTMIAYELEPGGSKDMSDDLSLINDLRPGRYRFVRGSLETQFELVSKE